MCIKELKGWSWCDSHPPRRFTFFSVTHCRDWLPQSMELVLGYTFRLTQSTCSKSLEDKTCIMCDRPFPLAYQDYRRFHSTFPGQPLSRKAILYRIVKEDSLKGWHLSMDFSYMRDQALWTPGEKVLKAEGRVSAKVLREEWTSSVSVISRRPMFLKWKWPWDKGVGGKVRRLRRARS